MSEFQIGQKASVKAVMSDEAVREFARISGDNNPLHLSDAYAEGTRFGKRIAHGILVSGQIRTGSYVNKDGQKVYTTEIVVTEQEFAEKKAVSPNVTAADEGFMNIQADIDGEGLPFQ